MAKKAENAFLLKICKIFEWRTR